MLDGSKKETDNNEDDDEAYLELWKKVGLPKPIEKKNELVLYAPWTKNKKITPKLPMSYYYYKRR
jgi:hypothetical protein